MKKLIALLLLISIIVGVVVYRVFIADSTNQTDIKNLDGEPKVLAEEVTAKEKDGDKTVLDETTKQSAEEQITRDIATKQEKLSAKKHSGINLSLDGVQLEESYQTESIRDYGWKSYWENELFVILMESSRAYPFIEQKTDCKTDTCKVEVTLSMEDVLYMEQAISAIDEEFAKREMPLAIDKVDLSSGIIGFYIQPGDINTE